MKPLVSICIPVYGVEKYIERCCRSLFEQTYSNIEFVFVNDCTPDNSIEIINNILQEYPERKTNVRICNHLTNKGLSESRNTAINASRGEYIIHVDSDDFIELNTVELAINKALETNADIIVFDMNIVYNNKTVHISSCVPDNKLKYLLRVLQRDSLVCVCGSMYKRCLYVDNDIYAIKGLNYGEDYVTKPRLIFFANKIVSLPVPLYNYVQYNSNSYTNTFTMKSIENILYAIDILISFFKDKCELNNFVDYNKIEKIIKIRNKVFLLEYCNIKDRSFVLRLFPEMNNVNLYMPLKHKVVWLLARHNQKNLLNIYIYISNVIKRTFHI